MRYIEQHNRTVGALMGRQSLVLVLLALAVQQHLSAVVALPAWRQCDSEKQIVQCGQIPLTRDFRADRLACCRMHRPDPLPAQAAAVQSMAVAQQVTVRAAIPRNDFTSTGYLLGVNLTYPYSSCAITRATATVPVFTLSGSSTRVTLANYTVPVLTKSLIQRIKSAASAALPAAGLTAVQVNATRLRQVNSSSGFIHPGGSAVGPAELALMDFRVRNMSAVQMEATYTLIDGKGVKPKTRKNPDGTTWAPPVNCNVGYPGPYAPTNISIRYSGLNWPGTPCPANYPALAPTNICGHVSFVELDAQMVYKMALAWYVTGNASYATRVLNIVDTWANRTTDFGVRWENGPLEAGWGIAAMARALELVRTQDTRGVIRRFISWVNGKPMTNMLYYSDTLTSKNIPNFYGNWHSTLAEAYMALGVLSDNTALYARGVALFNSTAADYLKWGKGSFATVGGTVRLLGECSETMRDMYHSQFGLGGLLQAAEIAWQQDQDLYSVGNYSLAAAMELHARITNAYLANMSTSMLPPGFRYYDTSMPKPPANCTWQFNMTRQKWTAVWTANGTVRSELDDGLKYVLGAGFLPTGWEMGYNHYVGRLGIRMPETAQLLSSSWPEWQEFHWGSGTLTHAETAQQLWRTGVTSLSCARMRSRRRGSGTASASADNSDLAGVTGSSRGSSASELSSSSMTNAPDSDIMNHTNNSSRADLAASGPQDLDTLQVGGNAASEPTDYPANNTAYLATAAAAAILSGDPIQASAAASPAADLATFNQSPPVQIEQVAGISLNTGSVDNSADIANTTTAATTGISQGTLDLSQQPTATATAIPVTDAMEGDQGEPADGQHGTAIQAGLGLVDGPATSASAALKTTTTDQGAIATDVDRQPGASIGDPIMP